MTPQCPAGDYRSPKGTDAPKQDMLLQKLRLQKWEDF